MSFSIQREVSDGTLSTIDLAIEYIDKTDISLYVDDSLIELTGGVTPYTWEWITDAQVKITPNVPNGLVAMIKRITPMAEPYHNFSAGAVFKDQSVDENFMQSLHLAQEAIEGSGATDFFADVDHHGYRIKNIAAALEGGDAIPFVQYQSDALGALASRQGAEAAKALADLYANEAEDVPVEPGAYSAYHWSKKAEVKVSTIGVSSFNGRTGGVLPTTGDYTKSDVGLANVDNTADLDKPISDSTQTALDLKANTNSAALTGIPTAPTATPGTNTTQIASTEFVLANVPTTNVDQLCTAWVNFNGSGVVAIRDSFNVSSITDNGTGDYTVNFTTAMANANYAPAGWVRDMGTTRAVSLCSRSTDIKTTAAIQVVAIQDNSSFVDSTEISVIIFGGK